MAKAKIGYKTPPTSNQFQKGKSGNPRGRPKGAKNKPKDMNKTVRDIILAEANRKVTINEASGQVDMTMIEATIRSMGLKGIKGNTVSQRRFIALANEAELSKTAHSTIDDDLPFIERFIKLKIITYNLINIYWTTDYPREIPKPDHIEYEVENDIFYIRGPVGQNEHRRWNWFWKIKGIYEFHQKQIENKIKEAEFDGENEGLINALKQDLQYTQSCIEIYDHFILAQWDVLESDLRFNKYCKKHITKDDWIHEPIMQEYCRFRYLYHYHLYLLEEGYDESESLKIFKSEYGDYCQIIQNNFEDLDKVYTCS